MSATEVNRITPKVSVIMSCYNEESTVSGAIESILNQSFCDFELILIDDGSTDNTFSQMKHWAKKDRRIHLYQNGRNCGLPAALNKGIRLSTAPIIARMDADDISLSQRLERQYTFLQKHKNVDVVGSNVFFLKGEQRETSQLPLTNDEINKQKYNRTVLIHPTVMLRKDTFDKYGYYDETLKWAEDKDLWLRWMGKVRFANLKEPLLWYTVKKRINWKIIRINHKVLIKNLVRRKEFFKNSHLVAWSILAHIKKWIAG